jgi:alkylation response protein AidB-like acyl-CoA dehydrogenase
VIGYLNALGPAGGALLSFSAFQEGLKDSGLIKCRSVAFKVHVFPLWSPIWCALRSISFWLRGMATRGAIVFLERQRSGSNLGSLPDQTARRQCHGYVLPGSLEAKRVRGDHDHN